MCDAVLLNGKYIDEATELAEELQSPVVSIVEYHAREKCCLCCIDIPAMAKNAGAECVENNDWDNHPYINYIITKKAD